MYSGEPKMSAEEQMPELEARYERLQNISDRLSDLESNLTVFQEKMGPPPQPQGIPKEEQKAEAGGREDFIHRLDVLSERMESQLNRLHSVMGDLRRML